MLVIIGFAIVAAWAYLAVGHGLFWLPLWPAAPGSRVDTPSVDIVIPARNEAKIITHALPSLLAQKYTGDWRVILVDDDSKDKTADAANKIAAEMKRTDRLVVVKAPPLPEGWSGKVSAMNAGVNAGTSDYILFTDADIRHPLNSLERLVSRAQTKNLDLVSRMVKLNCTSIAEKLLIPAFVFFFMMMYPFRQANSPNSPVAAAAGGVMLVRRDILDKIGGLDAIKSAIIDDCSLAKAIKQAGGQTEITLTEDIDSLRGHSSIKEIWKMIARTAYTQLNHSPFRLVQTIAGLFFLFVFPLLLVATAPSAFSFALGAAAMAVMFVLYAPMVQLYRMPVVWVLTLPIAVFFYGAATIDSARLYYKGEGGQWKGRIQAQKTAIGQ